MGISLATKHIIKNNLERNYRNYKGNCVLAIDMFVEGISIIVS